MSDLRPNYIHYQHMPEISTHILEGTGVLVFDHSNHIAFINKSKRATEHAIEDFKGVFGKH